VNGSEDFYSMDVNTTLTVKTNASLEDASILITRYNTSARRDSNVAGLDKFITIEASAGLEAGLQSAMLRIHYGLAEVAAAGLNESELRLWWYNTSLSRWQMLDADALSWVYESGVDTVNKFVYANVTHFSEYTIAGQSQTQLITLALGWNLISLPLSV